MIPLLIGARSWPQSRISTLRHLPNSRLGLLLQEYDGRARFKVVAIPRRLPMKVMLQKAFGAIEGS
jgi:hypothetical protein